ncbi:zinc finger protein swm [Condylostylus longicornis]|uniref:zinc finger protein swm n=1 Tax=Condylostylus longicornis TaxID=2530218 RepID=UPI00244DE353|nr:zinc finger protein swm [Condylostylus longicornis]
MIIDNPDALKGWLTVILQPLCDADPSALARYVFALLKKEKPIKELKKSMNEQLDVFLAEETKPFVERLFSAIASKEYLMPIAQPDEKESIETDKKEVENNNIEDDKIARECTPPLQQSQNVQQTTKAKDKHTEKLNSTTPSSSSTSAVTINQGTPHTPTSSVVISPISNTLSINSAKTASDKENNPRELRRRRGSLRSRSRSRSPSDRSRQRSRSRERRAQEREKMSRQFHNKSPPAVSERRRTERRGTNNERLGRGGANKSGRTRSHSASRSRSPSPELRKISRSISPSGNNDNMNNIVGKRQRCRDFDEKGYCVRGETCPWDHGVNPVVLEGINNSTAFLTMPQHLREYNPDAPELWNRGSVGAPFNGPRGTFPPIRPPGFRPAGPPFPFAINPAVTPLQRELIPVPVVDANAGGDVAGIAASNLHSKRRYEPEDTVAVAEGPIKRKIPINSRLGPRVTGGPQQNCSLELRKVPRGMNTIAHLNNHFSKFGKIINIQISYDGDPEAAIVTFSTHAEANVAYRSTEAVLNNRFIKVFWHSSGGESGPPNASNKEEIVANGRKSSQYHLTNLPATGVTTSPAVAVAATESAKTVSVPSAVVGLSQSSTPITSAANAVITTSASIVSTGAHTQTTSSTTQVQTTTAVITQPSMRLKNNTSSRPLPAAASIIRKKQEEQAKAVVQLAQGLRKRKQELIQEYLKQMKSAVELLERMDQNDPQRPKMLETIKNLQGNIDKLNKELSTEQEKVAAKIQSTTQPVKKTKEQQKKELLDIELELIAQQQEGNDTTAIQKKLEELQRSLGISASQKPHFGIAGTGIGPTRVNHRIRSAPASSKLDRRPKTLCVTGFVSEDSDLLLGHFKHFGEITKHEVDKSIPSLKITYATRLTAEQAAIRGRMFKDKQLQIVWVVAQTTNNSIVSEKQKIIQSPASDEHVANNKQLPLTTTNEKIAENLTSMDTNNLPELPLEDEEEDDESEDRSWRR